MAGTKFGKDRRVPDYGSAPLHGTSVTSTSLLRRVRQADPDGWNRLVSLYGPLVYSWCRQHGVKSQDAGDIVQEVFQAVLRNIKQFRRDRPGDTFRGWLRTITRNKVKDYWRRKCNQPDAEGGTTAQIRLAQVPDDEQDQTDEPQNSSDTNLVFQQALRLIRDEFESRTWQAFWQTAVERRAAADVAADLSMTANAVYIAKSRILGRIRVEFGELLD